MKFITTHLLLFFTFTLLAQETEIVQNNPMTNFELGKAVDISEDGNYAIAGLPGIGTTTGRAYIYILMGETWLKTAELRATDGLGGDAFGTSVSISESGVYAVIGAPLEDEDGSNSGAVYVFYFDGNGWTQQAKLKATDQANEDLFGNAVSISDDGNYVVIGAKKKDKSSSRYDSGAAYIFKRTADVWEEQVKLNPIDLQFEDEFGTAVSIDRTGENVIVSSPFDNDEGSNSGTVYTFKRTEEAWSNTAKLNASNASAGAVFGTAISLNADGTHAVIGAPQANNTAGLAYIFFRTGDYWTEMEKVNPDNPDSNQQFGQSVGISQNGDWVIVGAPGDNDSADRAGAAYVFKGVVNDCLWVQHCKQVATSFGENYGFGHAVAISDAGDKAIVGSPFADDYTNDSGAVYTFGVVNEICSTPQIIPNGARLGNSVDISADGNYCLVGAPNIVHNGETSGKVYVYRNNVGVWVEEAQLLSNDISSGDQFGWSLAVNSDASQCVIGAPHANGQNNRSGAAYVFNRTGTTWSQAVKLLPNSAQANDLFGASVDIAENAETVIVGVPSSSYESSNHGAVYVFNGNGVNWSGPQILHRIDNEAQDRFGTAVAINANGTYAMAGAPNAGMAGRVYAYALGLGQWNRAQVIAPDVSEGTNLAFGAAIDLNDTGNLVLVGAPSDETNLHEKGAAYLLNLNNGTWTQTDKIEATDGTGGDAFGAAVAIANNETYLAIGATGNDEGAINGGATYIYEAAGTWQQSNKIIATDIAAGDAFGAVVSLNAAADLMVIGSPFHDHTGMDNGAAYKYQCFESALPISLIDFDVFMIKKEVQINWTLESINGVEQFEIQRSSHAVDFKKIGIVSIKNEQTNYSFKDKNVIQNQRYYYRLKTIEMDNRSSFSMVKSIQMATENAIDFYPNPVQETLYFSYDFDENYQLEIWTMTGQLLLQKNLGHTLNVENLMKGTYVLKIKTATGKEVESRVFVKE